MDFYEEASLVMVPSGYKDQKVYSSVPDDGSADLTFSRASTATRVNSDGYIEKAQVNLLLQSNTFDTTWTNNGTTETSGQAGYDGTNDAWLITKSAASARVYQTISQSGVQTFSVYAKAGTLNWVAVSNNLVYTYFNLSAGTIGTNVGTIDANIEDAGSGWYRCSITYNGSVSDARIYPSQGDNDLTGTSGNIYIQDAQLNYGLVAQTYQETTTAAVVSGITNDMPRLNYDPANPTCPSLLLEPSRTNFESHSEYLNAAVIKDNVVISSNVTTSPEGINNASSVVDNTTSGLHRFYSVPSTTAASGATITHSIFAKADSHSWFQLSSGGQTNDQWANFDLANGVVGNSSASANADIQPMGNGWYRCIINSTTSATNALVATLPTLTNNTNTATRSPSYIGSGGGVFLYGLQIEIGSYPTSYIPTYGTSATRTADACSKTGISSLIGQTEGTLFVEIEEITEESAGYYLEISDNSNTNRILVQNGSGANRINVYAQSAAGTQVNTSPTDTFVGRVKIAIAYANNDFKVYANGSEVVSETSFNVPTCSKLSVGVRYNNTSQIGGNVNQVLLFKTRLPNSDLATLTTL